jgi:hypothetical protein
MIMNLKFALAVLLVFILCGGGQKALAKAAEDPTDFVVEPEVMDTDSTANASDDGQNPYGVITDRNVFRLTEPPAPAPPPPDVNLPVIKMTGLVKATGEAPRALFMSVPKDPKEATAFFNLGEGERQDRLEVIKINEAEESAEVINAGTRTTLSLKEMKESRLAAGPSGPPGQPGQPGQPNGNPSGIPLSSVVRPQLPQSSQPQEQSDNKSDNNSVMIGGGSPPPAANPSAAVTSGQQTSAQRLSTTRSLRIPPPPLPAATPSN